MPVSPRLEILAGGTAVITGGASGLGAALCRAAAAAEMCVVVADIDASGAEAMAAALRDGGGRAIAVSVDVSDPDSVEELAQRADETFGPIRLLINNAGVETLGYAWDIPAETWIRTLSINVLGAAHAVRAFVPRMAASQEPAFISNICSIGAILTSPLQSAYMASKHALLAFTECLSLDVQVARYPITVSAVLPGPVQTDIFLRATASETAGQQHRELMQQWVSREGISADTAANRILPAIAAGEFWISSHSELFAAQMRLRSDMFAQGARPALDT